MGNDGLRRRRGSIFEQFAVAPALFVAMADQILHDNPHVRRNIANFAARFYPRDFLQHHQMGLPVQLHLLAEDDGGVANAITPTQNTTAIAVTALSGWLCAFDWKP